MVTFRRLAYNAVLIPALLIAPGCGGEPPKAPEGAPTDDAMLKPPETELGEESTGAPDDSPEGDSTGSDSAPPENK